MKNISMIFLITIFLIAILNSVYADTGPYTGENQAKKIAQNYLNSNNLPYKATTTTYMIELYDYNQTNHKKWVSSQQFEIMKKNNETFEGKPVKSYYESGTNVAWKVNVENNQGETIGNIWVDGHEGNIIKVNLPTVDNATNQTTNATNITSQLPPEQTNNVLLFVAGLAIIIIAAGAGYWFYKKR